MAYTAVWWRTPGDILTGQYISMVRIVHKNLMVRLSLLQSCYIENNSFSSCVFLSNYNRCIYRYNNLEHLEPNWTFLCTFDYLFEGETLMKTH